MYYNCRNYLTAKFTFVNVCVVTAKLVEENYSSIPFFFQEKQLFLQHNFIDQLLYYVKEIS
jgi:hypothetical protein